MDLEQQLRAAFAPVSPGQQVRAAVKVRLAAQPRRRGVKPWVLASAALAIAAAAAMLVMRPWEPAASTVLAARVSPPQFAPGAEDDTPVLPASASVEVVPAKPDAEVKPAEPAIESFTVNVLPLTNKAVDASRKAAIETVYATLVDAMGAVPGLRLVRPAPGDDAAKAEYVVTVEGSALSPSSMVKEGDYMVNVVAQEVGPDGTVLSGLYYGAAGVVSAPCAGAMRASVVSVVEPCGDPVTVGQGLLATLRKSVFPPDPQLKRDMQARLFDQALDPAKRLQALQELGSLGRRSGAGMRAFPSTLRDTAVVRAAIQVASVATDPATRAQIWYTLRGSGDPVLLQPLVAALRTDADVDTRVQALATLEADFAADPQVRSVLATAGVGDPDPFVRALAQRAVGDERTWTEYVLATLKDAGRSPMERARAFFHAYGLPSWRQYGAFSLDARIVRELDDAAVRALTEVLPLVAADSTAYAYASVNLISDLASRDHPAITDMLLSGLDAGSAWLNRSQAVEALRRRTSDPGVSAVLEKIAREDPDPELRELAGKPLDASEKAGAAPQGPPRLGVSTDYVREAPGVAPELVGKLEILRMATGAPAERAGIKEGDILLEINGTPITSGPQLIEVLDALAKGVDVNVMVSRDGQALSLTARF